MARVLDDVNELLPFGKYSDKTIKWVLENDVQYLLWFADKSRTFIFSKEIQNKILAKINYEN